MATLRASTTRISNVPDFAGGGGGTDEADDNAPAAPSLLDPCP
jgi:hypothetical protein